jgi:hypothetical protein
LAFFNFFLSALTLIKLDPIPASQARMIVFTSEAAIDWVILISPLAIVKKKTRSFALTRYE